MGKRLELQTLLEIMLGSRNVYFQPPENVKLKYPCIMYSLSASDTNFANDNPYAIFKRYQVTIIDKNPDSEISEKMQYLPMCTFDRHYTADNLNHYVYNIYF